jgi:hypothetical protein
MLNAEHINERAYDQRVRRAVRRAGYLARKSRSKNPLENNGGYMIVDPHTGFPIFGFWYELSPEAAIEYCS